MKGRAAIVAACIGLTAVGCVDPQPIKPIVGAPMQIMLGVTPHCLIHGIMDWDVPITDTRLPFTATYAVQSYYPNDEILGEIVANQGATIRVTRVTTGWRLVMLGPDSLWHPVTNWVTSTPGTCILA